MTPPPRFVRFTAPFWFAMQGFYDEEDATVWDDFAGELVSRPEVPDDVPYVGVIHPGAVLPVAGHDEGARTVDVQLPKPWDEVQYSIPLDPDVAVPADGAGDAPDIEAVNVTRARELFPGELDPLTQDDLDEG